MCSNTFVELNEKYWQGFACNNCKIKFYFDMNKRFYLFVYNELFINSNGDIGLVKTFENAINEFVKFLNIEDYELELYLHNLTKFQKEHFEYCLNKLVKVNDNILFL